MSSATDEQLSRASSVAEPRPRRRWPLVVVGSIVVVVVLAVVGWKVMAPQWRPSLRAGERYGIDVSAHQGTVEWSQVADDDIEFAYVKATEGRDFTDVHFTGNRSAA